MAISSTKFRASVRYRVVVDSAVTASTLSENVDDGKGRLFSARVDNSKDASNAVYLKVYDTVGPSIGVTYPCLVLKVAAAATTTFQFPYGLPYDSLSFGLSGDANPISQTAPNMSTGVHLVCG